MQRNWRDDRIAELEAELAAKDGRVADQATRIADQDHDQLRKGLVMLFRTLRMIVLPAASIGDAVEILRRLVLD